MFPQMLPHLYQSWLKVETDIFTLSSRYQHKFEPRESKISLSSWEVFSKLRLSYLMVNGYLMVSKWLEKLGQFQGRLGLVWVSRGFKLIKQVSWVSPTLIVKVKSWSTGTELRGTSTHMSEKSGTTHVNWGATEVRLVNVKDLRRQMAANEEHCDSVHVALTSWGQSETSGISTHKC